MRARIVLFALTLLAPLTAAQDEQQALKALKAESKALLKTHKLELAQMADELDSQIDIFQLHFADLAGDDGPIEDFVAALLDFQAAASAAEDAQASGLSQAAGQVLNDLPAGGADEDVAPPGLMCGDGGLVDDHLAAARQATAKAYAAVNKKLAKLCAKLRKQTDMRLTIVLQPVQPRLVAPVPLSAVAEKTQALDIDVVVGFNRGGVEDDGRVWAGGWAFPLAGDVLVTVSGDDFADGTDTPSVLTNRWSVATDPEAEPLEEGNYLVYSVQDNVDGSVEAIGLR